MLKAQPHSSFERSGNDLLTTVKITLSESLLGFSRVVLLHLDGRGIQITSTPGKVIKPGDTILLKGEGMPIYKRPEQKGDLYVRFDVEFPTGDFLKSIDSEVLSCVILKELIADRYHSPETRITLTTQKARLVT